MFFRSLTFFRFPTAAGSVMPSSIGAAIDEALDEALPDCALKPVGPLELSSRGFVSPYGRDSQVYTQRLAQCVGICVGGEDKILPAAVVNDLLGKKIAEVMEEKGLVPGGKSRKRMKEDLVAELLPRAFVQPSRTSAFLDFNRGLICIDHAGRNAAEQVVSQIRHAVGSFPAVPLNAEVSPRSVLTGWLAGEPMPEGLSLGSDCELREAGDRGHIVKITAGELRGDEVAKHLEAGMQCTRLALYFDDRLSFTIGEDLVVRRLKFLEGATEQLGQDEREDLAAELDARFILNVGEIAGLFDLLAKAFKLSSNQVEEEPLLADPSRAAVPEAATSPKVRKAARKAVESLQATADKLGATMTISGVDRATGKEEVLLQIEPKAGKGKGRVAAPAVKEAGDANSNVDYSTAVDIVRKTGKTTISHLQRVMQIGYNRAARLIEQMEARGVVSPPSNTGDRTLLSPAKDSKA